MKIAKYSLVDQLLTERFINIGDTSVVLPAGIQGVENLNLTDPQNSRERRAATVLRRFRDGISAGEAARFGSIGEDLVAAVLGGQQTNTYWDQNSLFSDVLVGGTGGTYYSVKASENPDDLEDQGINLPKIENLLTKTGGESISVGIAMISVDENGNDLNIEWTAPITLAKEDFGKIRKNKDPTGEMSPKWLYKVKGRMGWNAFQSLMQFAGKGEKVGKTKKSIILPPTPAGGIYDLGTNEIRNKFRETFNSFRLAPDLNKEQEAQLRNLLNQIAAIFE